MDALCQQCWTIGPLPFHRQEFITTRLKALKMKCTTSTKGQHAIVKLLGTTILPMSSLVFFRQYYLKVQNTKRVNQDTIVL